MKSTAILVLMLAMLYFETLVPGSGSKQRLIRLGFDITAFALLPLAVKVWPSDKGRFPARRWTFFYVVLLVGLPILVLWLIPFVEQHPSLRDANARLVLWAGDWYPVIVTVPVAIFMILRAYYRSRRQ